MAQSKQLMATAVELDCKVCFTTEGTRRLRQCGHVLCPTCWEEMCKRAMFRCGECRKPFHQCDMPDAEAVAAGLARAEREEWEALWEAALEWLLQEEEEWLLQTVGPVPVVAAMTAEQRRALSWRLAALLRPARPRRPPRNRGGRERGDGGSWASWRCPACHGRVTRVARRGGERRSPCCNATIAHDSDNDDDDPEGDYTL